MTKIAFKLLFVCLSLSGCDSTSSTPELPDEPQRLAEVWSHSFHVSGGTSLQPTVLNRDIIVFPGTQTLVALDLKKGDEKWETTILRNRTQLQGRELLFDSDRVYGIHLGEYLAWDIDTGEIAWVLEAGDGYEYAQSAYPAIDDTYIYTGNHGGDLNIIAKSTGDVVIARRYHSRPRGLAIVNRELYFQQAWSNNDTGLIHGQIMKVEPISGDTLWAFRTDQGGFWRNRPLVENGIVFAGSVGNSTSGSVFVALDAQTGEPVWQQPGVHTFTWTHGPRYLYINDSRDLVALDKANGSIVWRTPLQAGSGEAHVAYMDGYVYHPHGAALFVLDGETGEIVHAEVPEDGTYYWQVGVGAGKVFTWTSRHFLALEPYRPE